MHTFPGPGNPHLSSMKEVEIAHTDNEPECVSFQDADVIERLNERGELRNILRPFKVKKGRTVIN